MVFFHLLSIDVSFIKFCKNISLPPGLYQIDHSLRLSCLMNLLITLSKKNYFLNNSSVKDYPKSSVAWYKLITGFVVVTIKM